MAVTAPAPAMPATGGVGENAGVGEVSVGGIGVAGQAEHLVMLAIYGYDELVIISWRADRAGAAGPQVSNQRHRRRQMIAASFITIGTLRRRASKSPAQPYRGRTG
jgi:hypothetical protein